MSVYSNLTARHVDRAVPDGEAWHRQLATRMAQAVPDVRPAVISPEIATDLDEYRRFRHLVRNLYATKLVPAKMQRLVERLPVVWSSVRAELVAFASFLERISPDLD